MRVFVPVTIVDLRHLAEQGRLEAPCGAWAVTDDLTALLGDVSEEEAEFAVTTAAAESSLELLMAGDMVPRRRVVVVAEVPNHSVSGPGDTAGLVRLRAHVLRRQVDAILADAVDIDPSAEAPEELAWFAVQEIGDLLA